MLKSNIFIIIPAYNEQPRLPKLLSILSMYFPLSQVIVVDDGSVIPLTIPSRFRVWILRHGLNLGKGAAMKTGARFAISHHAEGLIFMDGDLQHDPKDIPKFINGLAQGNDVVFGCRRLDNSIPVIRRIGNQFASLLVKNLFGIYISDLLCGFRAMSVSAFKVINWQSSRYGVETEMVVMTGKKGLRYCQIPLQAVYYDKFKGVTILDAVSIFFDLIFWKIKT